MTEWIAFYIVPAIVSFIGCVLTMWGTEEITVGDLCLVVVITLMPGMNLLCALMFINMGVTEVLIPSMSFIWDRTVWRKKDK